MLQVAAALPAVISQAVLLTMLDSHDVEAGLRMFAIFGMLPVGSTFAVFYFTIVDVEGRHIRYFCADVCLLAPSERLNIAGFFGVRTVALSTFRKVLRTPCVGRISKNSI